MGKHNSSNNVDLYDSTDYGVVTTTYCVIFLHKSFEKVGRSKEKAKVKERKRKREKVKENKSETKR